MVDDDPERVGELLASLDWDFADADTGRDGHSAIPYPAKFPPQIPERLIGLLSYPGELVLDCFGGSGTTAVEARRLGRVAYTIDANPVAALLSRVKTGGIDHEARRQLTLLRTALYAEAAVERACAEGVGWCPEIPNIDKWYAPHVVDELAALRYVISSTTSGQANALAMCVFAHIASKLSFQDSETRYKSVPRNVPKGRACERFLADLRRLMAELPSKGEAPDGGITVVQADARDPLAYTASGTVDLVVTSPPYPNAYDYHLYHRFRLFWLGEDPAALRRVEIGSHLRNQSLRDPAGEYERDMVGVLSNVAVSLRPGRYAVFVVGDGIHRSQPYHTADALADLACLVGLDCVTVFERQLPSRRRSVTHAGRRLQTERLLILRKPQSPGQDGRKAPVYDLYPYEEDLAVTELKQLASSQGDVRQAAFTYAVSTGDEVVATWQAASEFDSKMAGRKNSTYASHGIHRYKGKFYPQLAKALINVSGAYDRTGVVLDPFGGSGTVALEARLSGLNAVSIDINPVAVATAEAKQTLLDTPANSLGAAIGFVLSHESAAHRHCNLEQFREAVRDELESWFAPSVLVKLSWLLAAVRDPKVEGFTQGLGQVFEVLVSDLIREVSQQEPSDLRIRRRREPLEDAPVWNAFRERSYRLLHRHRSFQHRLQLGPSLGSAAVIMGDAADGATLHCQGLAARGVASVVSSPPYGTALPYLDTDRLSLAAVFGVSRAERNKLELALIGSREISNRDQAAWESALSQPDSLALPSSTLDFLDGLQSAVASDPKAGFRRRQTPAVLLRYFARMNAVLANVAASLTSGAEVILILGDSSTTIAGRRWTIPTVDEVRAIAKQWGLAAVDDIPITVTREALLNSHNAIIRNRIVRFRSEE